MNLFYLTEKIPAQVAIRWLLQTPPVTSVIFGTTKMHQLEDNMGAAGWKLTEEEVRFRSRSFEGHLNHCCDVES